MFVTYVRGLLFSRRMVPAVDPVKPSKVCDVCIALENAPVVTSEPTAKDKSKSIMREMEALILDTSAQEAVPGLAPLSSDPAAITPWSAQAGSWRVQPGEAADTLTPLRSVGRRGPRPAPHHEAAGEAAGDGEGKERLVRGNSVFNDLSSKIVFSSDEDSDGDAGTVRSYA